MIKRNGDWTGKFIDTLYKAKGKMLKVDDFGIKIFDENHVFNLLNDLDNEKSTSTASPNSQFPKIHIS
jgi:hypothetical protein